MGLEVAPGGGQDLTHLFDPGVDRVEGPESALRMPGDHLSECGLARTRRAVEDQRGDAVGIEHASEELAGGEKVFLTDELVGCERPHPGGQGHRGEEVALADIVEQVDGGTSVRSCGGRTGIVFAAARSSFGRQRAVTVYLRGAGAQFSHGATEPAGFGSHLNPGFSSVTIFLIIAVL